MVNGDLLQEGLCHTQGCCTQSPCPCGSSLLTRTSIGDAQTQAQFCLSLCGVPGSWCAQGLFEPSEHLWWEWGLILNANSPLLPSCWGFSFALGCGVSPHSHSSTYRLTGVSLTLGVRYWSSTVQLPLAWFQIGKGVCQGCILSPGLFNFYAEYIIRNAELDEA